YLLRDHVTPQSCAMLLLTSATTFAAAAGMAMRFAVWQSTFKRLLVLIFTYSLLAVPLVCWWGLHEKYGNWPFAAIAVVFVAVAVAAVQSARMAWRNLELA